jgi:hypothetical protein|nr:MAG: hypothetical protein [Lake Baikal virophage 2]
MDKKLYLSIARIRAKEAGYDPALLTLSKDSVHKLSYNGVRFGAIGYNDFIIYSWLESIGKVSQRDADKYRRNYRKRASNIKGNWKNNPVSPNNLALRILW